MALGVQRRRIKEEDRVPDYYLQLTCVGTDLSYFIVLRPEAWPSLLDLKCIQFGSAFKQKDYKTMSSKLDSEPEKRPIQVKGFEAHTSLASQQICPFA